MSARVFSSFRLLEIRGTMRGAGVDGSGGGDRRSRVRVNLFGTVDHEEVRRTLNTELAEQERRDAEKYNFNFRMTKPKVGGRFDWVAPGTEVPAAYELRGMPFIRSHAAEDERPSAEGSSPASGPSNADETVESRTAAVGAESEPPRSFSMKQSRITDFHQNRKRLLTQAKASTTSQSPTSAADASSTIFKKARVQES